MSSNQACEMSKPTILLVGGAWHTADYLSPLVATLEAAGYPTKALGLPSVGAKPCHLNFGEDVTLIRDTAIQLVYKEGKRVVAVFHSYGGIPGTEALQGFRSGNVPKGTGALLGLVYIATMLPEEGHNFKFHVESVQDHAWYFIEEHRDHGTQMIKLPSDDAANLFYNDLEPESSKHWTSLLKPQSTSVFWSRITHETYRDIPSAYLLTENDQWFRHDSQRRTAKRAGVTVTKTIKTGHTPFLTKPEEVTEFIVSFAAGLDV